VNEDASGDISALQWQIQQLKVLNQEFIIVDIFYNTTSWG
jgi:hypothetical protein